MSESCIHHVPCACLHLLSHPLYSPFLLKRPVCAISHYLLSSTHACTTVSTLDPLCQLLQIHRCSMDHSDRLNCRSSTLRLQSIAVANYNESYEFCNLFLLLCVRAINKRRMIHGVLQISIPPPPGNGPQTEGDDTGNVLVSTIGRPHAPRGACGEEGRQTRRRAQTREPPALKRAAGRDSGMGWNGR